jgi:hypothetical protein
VNIINQVSEKNINQASMEIINQVSVIIFKQINKKNMDSKIRTSTKLTKKIKPRLGNSKREKTTECFFLYVFKNYIHWKHPTSFVFQLQLEGGSNPLVSQATT